MITGFILIYFDFPQFSDDLTPDCVQQLIGMHLLVANIAVIAVVAVFAVIAVGCGYTKQEGARRQRHSSEMFRNSIATKLSDSCSMLLDFFFVLRRTARRTARRVQAQTPLVQQHCGLTVDCSILFRISRQLVRIGCHTPNAHSPTEKDPPNQDRIDRMSEKVAFWAWQIDQLDASMSLQHVALPCNPIELRHHKLPA